MSANAAIFNPTESTSAATGDGFSVPRLSTTGRLAITFGTGDKGMMVYDTTLNNLFIWNGSAWESVPASGDAGANGAVQYNDNGIIAGASGFFWDKANNRVGIGTASPQKDLEVANTGADCRFRINSTSVVATEYFRSGTGVWLVGSDSTNDFKIARASNFGGAGEYFSIASATGAATWLDGSGGTRMLLNSSGNLGLGVTPSAGGSVYYRTLEMGKAGCGLFVATSILTASELTFLSSNGVLAYNAGPEWKYGNNGLAGIYGIEDGVHKWYNATTGTAGNVFVPTQAMTLDASGNLLVGTTTAGIGGSANTRFTVKGNSDTYFSLIASGGEEMIAACQAGVVKIGSFNNNRFELLQNNNTKVTIDTSGNFIPLLTATAPALGTNSQMVFNLTSNTNLRISVRGTDGTTRTANITLA